MKCPLHPDSHNQESLARALLSNMAILALLFVLTPIGVLYALAQCVFVRGFVCGSAFTAMLLHFIR